MREFKKFEVWKTSRTIVKEIYTHTMNFPDEEKFGLTNQLRRAVVSISANIAEGAGRKTEKDFKHFLNMAFGSALEVECLLILANDLEFLKEDKFVELNNKIIIVQKQLSNFIKALN